MAVSLRHALAQALAVCGILAVCPAFVDSLPTASSGTPSTCAELRAWAEAYRDATLTLDEFARFDRAERRALFAAVTPAVRSALWREQLRRLDQQQSWSSQQHGLFRKGMRIVSLKLYEGRPDAQKALEAFKGQVYEAFKAPEERRVWHDLGIAISAGTVSRVPYCNCSLSVQDCWGGMVCLGSPCEPYSPGCGFAGAGTCTGMCF